jgi:hypothetical protein
VIPEYQVEAAAQALAMADGCQFDMPVKDAYERIARSVLKAAYAAKEPVPEIVVTEEMIAAGKVAFERDTRGGGKTFRNIYTAMHKASPKEAPVEAASAAGVTPTDECVKRAMDAQDKRASPIGPIEMARILTAALPYLTGHTGVAAACAAEGSEHEHVWVKHSDRRGREGPTRELYKCAVPCCGLAKVVEVPQPTGHKAREAQDEPKLFLRAFNGKLGHYTSPNERKGERRDSSVRKQLDYIGMYGPNRRGKPIQPDRRNPQTTDRQSRGGE